MKPQMGSKTLAGIRGNRGEKNKVFFEFRSAAFDQHRCMAYQSIGQSTL
jgi:hypothetical protein